MILDSYTNYEIRLSWSLDLESIRKAETSVLDNWNGFNSEIKVDISKVLDLSPDVLPAFLKFYLKCKTYHIELYFVAPSPRIFLVLKRSGLLEVLPVFLSQEEYLKGNRVTISNSKFY